MGVKGQRVRLDRLEHRFISVLALRAPGSFCLSLYTLANPKREESSHKFPCISSHSITIPSVNSPFIFWVCIGQMPLESWKGEPLQDTWGCQNVRIVLTHLPVYLKLSWNADMVVSPYLQFYFPHFQLPTVKHKFKVALSVLGGATSQSLPGESRRPGSLGPELSMAWPNCAS